jgi:hypothetical protein
MLYPLSESSIQELSARSAQIICLFSQNRRNNRRVCFQNASASGHVLLLVLLLPQKNAHDPNVIPLPQMN